MADIKQALGKGKTIEIDGMSIELKPLVVENLDTVLKLQNESTKVEGMKEILMYYLIQAFPNATEEERKQVDMKTAMDILKAGMQVNGLADKTE